MFLTTLLAATLTAPVPKDKSVYYFPVVLGTKRVLERTSGPTVVEVEEEVTKAEEKDGVYTVTLTSTPLLKGDTKRVGFSMPYRVTDKKVVRTFGDVEYLMFDLAVKAGESWTVESRGVGDTTVKTTFTVGKEEEVEVPAGKFRAVSVVEQRQKSEKKSTRWYAAEVGVVKEETNNFGESVSVLKSFTPGKEEKK